MSPITEESNRIGNDNRARVLLFVMAFHRRHKRGPGYDDMLDALDLSRSVLHKHLHALRAEGLVDFEDGKHGTLRPLVEVVWDDASLLEAVS